MKPVESPNAAQDESNESTPDPMAKLANQYSQIMERLRGPEKAVDLPRHQRRCKICRHSDRQAIEHEFLEWRSPSEIASDYDIPDRATIYRHAHATGLFLRRRRTFRGAPTALALLSLNGGRNEKDGCRGSELMVVDTGVVRLSFCRWPYPGIPRRS